MGLWDVNEEEARQHHLLLRILSAIQLQRARRAPDETPSLVQRGVNIASPKDA